MFCGLSLFSVEDLSAQTLEWETFIGKILEDAETDSSWMNFYEELCALHENPININDASTEEYSQIPFLSSQQIESIEAYVYEYGPVKSLGELNLIKDLDYDTRQMLHFFLYCGKSKMEQDKLPIFNNLLKYGKNELILRTDVPFYELSNDYLGSKTYHSIRYKYKYKNKLDVGFVTSKDQGEPMFNSVNKGLDSYSYYVSLSNMNSIKKIIIGNYRLGFGQGLILNTNFNLGKSSFLYSSSSFGQGIKPHSSTSESNYFQGIASTIQVGKLDISAFYSYKHVDATLNSDQEITALKTDGYHRTLLEISKKGNVLNQLMGTYISYDKNPFHLGITLASTFYNHPFKENKSGYKLYYPSGKFFLNTSIDYGFKSYKFTLSGETALDQKGGFATLNSFCIRLIHNLQITLLYRYYNPQYNSIYGSSFTEGGKIKNEQGIYMGFNASISNRWKFNGYVDLFQFPYLRYGISKNKSNGLDLLSEIRMNSSDNFSLDIRYRNKMKQGNYQEGSQKGFAYTTNQKLMTQINYIFSNNLKGKTILNLVHVKEGRKDASVGYSFSQSFQLKMNKIPLLLSVNGIYYHTDDYDSRIYSYEQGLLYSFSIPSYYGKGYRISSLIQYNLSKKLSFQCKYGCTYSISNKTNKSLLNLQVKYSF